jgi:hypothetical protein
MASSMSPCLSGSASHYSPFHSIAAMKARYPRPCTVPLSPPACRLPTGCSITLSGHSEALPAPSTATDVAHLGSAAAVQAMKQTNGARCSPCWIQLPGSIRTVCLVAQSRATWTWYARIITDMYCRLVHLQCTFTYITMICLHSTNCECNTNEINNH